MLRPPASIRRERLVQPLQPTSAIGRKLRLGGQVVQVAGGGGACAPGGPHCPQAAQGVPDYEGEFPCEDGWGDHDRWRHLGGCAPVRWQQRVHICGGSMDVLTESAGESPCACLYCLAGSVFVSSATTHTPASRLLHLLQALQAVRAALNWRSVKGLGTCTGQGAKATAFVLLLFTDGRRCWLQLGIHASPPSCYAFAFAAGAIDARPETKAAKGYAPWETKWSRAGVTAGAWAAAQTRGVTLLFCRWHPPTLPLRPRPTLPLRLCTAGR